MRLRSGLVMGVILLMASCGGTSGTTTTASGGDTTPAEVGATSTIVDDVTTSAAPEATEDPCALVTPEVVASTFGATSASGEAGIAGYCSFTLADGVASSVVVFHYGSSSEWDGVKSGYEDNRGGTTEVPGLGEEAYQPNDVGPYEIVVRSGDVIFAVAVQTGRGGPEVEAAIMDLAQAIAGG